jgi:hypothetical protein
MKLINILHEIVCERALAQYTYSSSVEMVRGFLLLFTILNSIIYRQVPRKPRLVGGDESAQFINNQI